MHVEYSEPGASCGLSVIVGVAGPAPAHGLVFGIHVKPPVGDMLLPAPRFTETLGMRHAGWVADRNERRKVLGSSPVRARFATAHTGASTSSISSAFWHPGSVGKSTRPSPSLSCPSEHAGVGMVRRPWCTSQA